MTNCVNCGQQGYGQPPQEQGARKPVNGKRIGIIAGVVVALVLVIVIVTKFTGPGAPTQKAAIKSYVEAGYDKDVDDYLDVCTPKKLLHEIKKEFKKENGNYDLEDKIERILSRGFAFSDADDIRRIKIIDKEKNLDIRDFEDQIKDKYNVKINISELVFVRFEYELKYNSKWEEHSGGVILYKTGGRWFVFSNNVLVIRIY